MALTCGSEVKSEVNRAPVGPADHAENRASATVDATSFTPPGAGVLVIGERRPWAAVMFVHMVMLACPGGWGRHDWLLGGR
jgi:hypothetical protein